VGDMAKSADLAVDHDMETGSHTVCAYNEDISYHLHFGSMRCLSEVVIVNSRPENVYRMNDLEVHIRNTAADESSLCGTLKARGGFTDEEQTYKISCDGKCGDSVMLKVNHDQTKYTYPGCIHMKEIGLHYSGS
jgi:hypothetical protein